MIDTIVGVNIALLRNRYKLSSDELSLLICVPTEELELVERGASRATPAILLALSKALDVPVSSFFRGWEQIDNVDGSC